MFFDFENSMFLPHVRTRAGNVTVLMIVPVLLHVRTPYCVGVRVDVRTYLFVLVLVLLHVRIRTRTCTRSCLWLYSYSYKLVLVRIYYSARTRLC